MPRSFGRRFVLTLGGTTLLAAALLTGIPEAAAKDWPSKPITFIVPFPPGGTSDANSRIMAEVLSKGLGQTIVVENRPGANGNIGAAAIAQAAPDGYTIGLSGVGTHAINPSLYSSIPYDAVKDFTHISLFASGANAIVVTADFPAKSLRELIALAKAQPGTLNFASAGNGSSGHLSMEMLKQQAGIELNHIPYKGGAPAITDVLGGQVPILVINQDAVLQHVQSGRLRVLAVTSSERSTLYPDVPTVAESGFPGFEATSWTGLSGPAGLPEDITKRLHDELAKALNEPKLRSRLEETGFKVGNTTPEEYAAFVASEVENWRRAVKAAGATVN